MFKRLAVCSALLGGCIVLLGLSYIQCLFMGFRDDVYALAASNSANAAIVSDASRSFGVYVFEGSVAVGWQSRLSQGGHLAVSPTFVPSQNKTRGFTIKYTSDRVPTSLNPNDSSPLAAIGVQFGRISLASQGYNVTCNRVRLPGGIVIVLASCPLILLLTRRWKSRRLGAGFEPLPTNREGRI
jgi:hypothetical protein